MAVSEDKWRCRSCGVQNPRAELQCLCGTPRGKDEELLKPDAPAVTDPKPNAPAVTKPAVLVAASAGPNWFCGSCGVANVHDAATCKQCSGSRTQPSDGRKVQATEPRREVERSTGMRVRDEPSEAMAALGAPLLSLSSLRACAVVAVVPVACIAFLVWVFAGTKEVEATVAETKWTRSIQIDQLGPREEGWDRPSDSEVIQTEQRLRVQEVPVTVTKTRKATKEVPTGETRKVKTGRKIDAGNGKLKDEEKEEPVTKTVIYDEEYEETELRTTVVPATWYVYRAWRKLRTEELSGERDPRWPTVVLLPEQRSSTRREEFSVVFLTTEGNTHNHSPSDEGEFQQFQKGSTRRLSVNNVGWLISIK